MKKFKKNGVVILMTISQLLLTVFVIYWLMGQYKDEKHVLHRELNRDFIDSERMMIDSMLATHLIDPFLSDSSGKIEISIRLDSSNPDKSHFRRIHSGAFNAKDRLKRVDFTRISNDSLRKGDSLLAHFKDSVDTTYSYLYRGARMIFGRMRGMDRNEESRISFIRSNADTLILKKAFNNRVQQRHNGFEVIWIAGLSHQEMREDRLKMVSHVLESKYVAEIKHYHLYLFKAISPQVLFGLLLLLVTAFSFRISYLNIRKQRRLLLIKNEFISNITHELKTPVSTVKVALEALLDFEMKKNPEVVQEYLEMSLLEMNRLDLLVSKVLNNSVLENGNHLFNSEDINLVQLIEEVIQSQKYRFEKSGAAVNFISDLKEAKVLFDRLHLQGVLLNLIDNSLKYAGGKVKVDLTLNQDETIFLISVKDNGPGIPKEYLDKVFDKFFRVPTNDQHNVKGHGLGLSYAMLVMQNHQGDISVQNLPEGGCEFMLIIPIKQS